MYVPGAQDTIGQGRPPRRRGPRLGGILMYAAVGVVALLAGIVIGSSTKSTPAAHPAPAATVFTPGARVTVPPETITATVTATPQAQPGQVLLKHSGSGNWNSTPFEVGSGSPQLKVTYSYSGNGSYGSADNFSADIENGSDDQLVANDIAYSGGKTTTIYPDTSFGGGTSYHLSVTATGNWSFTITEIS